MTTRDQLQATLSESAPSIATLTEGMAWIQGTQEIMFPRWATIDTEMVSGTEAALSVDTPELHRKMLKKSLHAAVKLEFATIPPYLCALWSIKDELHDVAKSIREIVQEEMLHLALVSNMLASLGEVPRFNTDVPRYPGKLPGDVHPKLIVKLIGFGERALKTFMQIELPEKIIPHGHAAARTNEEARTIGRFYSCIERAFDQLRPTFRPDNQITGPLSNAAITSVEDVRRAIKVIRDQGEGSSESPFDSGIDDLSHYYRFEELFERKRLEYDPVKKEFFHGKPIAWPDCWPMKVTPRGGYKQQQVPAKAWLLLTRFDELYSQMLDLLQTAWTASGQASFLRAIELMFALEAHAKPLMQIEVPGDSNYTLGPCFRYVKEEDRTFIRDREACNERQL